MPISLKERKKKLYVAERIKAYTLIGIGVVCYIYIVNIGRKSIGTVGVAERGEETSRQPIGAEPQRDSCLYPLYQKRRPFLHGRKLRVSRLWNRYVLLLKFFHADRSAL